MKPPKTKTTERLHWLHKQIAYNLVTLAGDVLKARRSPFAHKAHERFALECALSTQRNTLRWLPPEDRKAIIDLAKEDMKNEREAQVRQQTYAFVRYDAPVHVNGTLTKWCHFAAAHPELDLVAIAKVLASERGYALCSGESLQLITPEAAQAVAA